MTVAELVGGVGLLAYGGYLIFEPLAWCVPGAVFTLDAFLGGRN